MFKIRITLVNKYLSGLEAIDERRRLGLPDDSELRADAAVSIYADVGEGFARLHFASNNITQDARVDQSILTPSDVEQHESCPIYFRMRKDMSPERVKEIYVASNK